MDKYAPEAVKSLHSLHIHARSDPTIDPRKGNTSAYIEPGRPDLACNYKGFGWFVEVKNNDTAFAFSQWSDNQRWWYAEHCLPYEHHLWFWLALGSDMPHLDPQTRNPRRTWLFPVTVMLYAEAMLSPYQKSIPYRVKKGMRAEVQQQNLDAISLFEDYELKWSGNSTWTIPDSHVFRKSYLQTGTSWMLNNSLTLPLPTLHRRMGNKRPTSLRLNRSSSDSKRQQSA